MVDLTCNIIHAARIAKQTAPTYSLL